MTLRNRILVSILAGVLGSIFLLGAILMVRVHKNFERYLMLEQQLQMANLVEEIQTVYLNNAPSSRELERLAEAEHIYLRLYDTDGNLLQSYDGIPSESTMHGHYVENTVPVLNTYRQQIGTMEIGYWDHSLLSQTAANFTRSLTVSTLLAMLAAFVMAFFSSFYISRRITRPVEEIMAQTEKIRQGDFSLRPAPQGFAVEFDQLTDNINTLSDTLKTQESSRKKYAQDIAHELKTPVTALNLHVSAMLDGILPANEENLRAIRYEITRLNRMTEMLKSTFDAQESTDRIHIESVDCTALLNELADSLRPMLNKDRVQITLSLPAELVTETDKEKLRQILYNLLSNAKKAVDQGGRIRIEGHKTKKDIVLTVADDGIGIRSVDLPHIFDRFYRADTARNTKKGGTGLGLAIVKSHIQSLHGTIRVESTPGEGSRFTITLPLYWPGQEKNPASS